MKPTNRWLTAWLSTSLLTALVLFSACGRFPAQDDTSRETHPALPPIVESDTKTETESETETETESESESESAATPVSLSLPPEDGARRLLIFADKDGTGNQIVQILEAQPDGMETYMQEAKLRLIGYYTYVHTQADDTLSGAIEFSETEVLLRDGDIWLWYNPLTQKGRSLDFLPADCLDVVPLYGTRTVNGEIQKGALAGYQVRRGDADWQNVGTAFYSAASEKYLTDYSYSYFNVLPRGEDLNAYLRAEYPIPQTGLYGMVIWRLSDFTELFRTDANSLSPLIGDTETLFAASTSASNMGNIEACTLYTGDFEPIPGTWRLRLGQIAGIHGDFYTLVPTVQQPAQEGTDDVRYVAEPYYVVLDKTGAEIFRSPAYTEILTISDRYVAVVQDGRLRLLNADDGALLADFCDWTDDMFCHTLLSSYCATEKDIDGYNRVNDDMYRRFDRQADGSYAAVEAGILPPGMYIVTEDRSEEESYETPFTHYGRGKEYFYCPGADGEATVGYLALPFIGGYAKPVLYLYPTAETDVTVRFGKPEVLTTTYPKYDSACGWQVSASPDGTLTAAHANGQRTYYALYWEEATYAPADFSTGFCVAADDAAAFLEDSLAALGFTEREANECILYWLPILEKNPYTLVHFECTAEREAVSPLAISPAPDTRLRVALHLRRVEEPVSVTPQALPRTIRQGFTVVEWGGVVE